MNLKFTIDDKTLLAFSKRFRTAKEKQIRIALGDIRREWHAELVRQFDEFPENVWEPLKTRPIGRSYSERKAKEFDKGKIKYNTTLKRTGRMFDGYLRGIRVDDVNFSVSIPYPRSGSTVGNLNIRAKSHQGDEDVGLPVGVVSTRPLSRDSFLQIGRNILKAAISSDPKKGTYRGYNR